MNCGHLPQMVYIKSHTENTVVVDKMRQRVLSRIADRLAAASMGRVSKSAIVAALPAMSDVQLLDLLDELR